jgi:hypothetical protein
MSTRFALKMLAAGAACLLGAPAYADPFFFSTGNPDGLIATLSQQATPTQLETETADDFVTTAQHQTTVITDATFTGLIVNGTTANVNNVEIELYHIFPLDSGPFDGRVTTRMNSPGDNEFLARDGMAHQLTFSTTVLNQSFHANNSVVTGINTFPNQFTGGEGPVTGTEVQFNIHFNQPIQLGGLNHVFFRPEVGLDAGQFLWLSAPKPTAPPLFTGDLQTWIRNDGPGALAPDWSRIGSDITDQGPFNAAFSLTGSTVPEPTSLVLLGAGIAGLVLMRRRSKRLAG